MRLRFFYGDGANHVGLCQVFLIDPADPTKQAKIAEVMDCARTDHAGPGRKGEDLTGHMTVTIPSDVPCDPAHCVLQWVWIATHRSITRPEYYDDCADIAIADARQTTVTAALSVPTQHAKNPTPRPHGGVPPQLTHGEDLVRQMIAQAEVNRGSGNAEAITALKHQIEALP